ncbi:ribulose-phosphate 3-epimerase [Candidatus Peregrinibacteria bacterium]|nr:ribulose-phosphate 3-epimerase [Candidatus Peregrinibacteria bacterium]
MKIKISPSILSADFGKLNDEIKSVEKYSDYIHVDVMDGHFVPNITIGACVVSSIKTRLPLDVHLMIEHPEKYIEDFADAGAKVLTVHYEACKNLKSVLVKIRKLRIKAGVSIKPKTKIEVLKPYLKYLDWVLIMSVEPGFGGQKFIENSLDKIKWLRKNAPKLDIAVDGGINEKTAKECVKAGANVLIAGSYIFKAKIRKSSILRLKG